MHFVPSLGTLKFTLLTKLTNYLLLYGACTAVQPLFLFRSVISESRCKGTAFLWEKQGKNEIVCAHSRFFDLNQGL